MTRVVSIGCFQSNAACSGPSTPIHCIGIVGKDACHDEGEKIQCPVYVDGMNRIGPETFSWQLEKDRVKRCPYVDVKGVTMTSQMFHEEREEHRIREHRNNGGC